MWARASLITRSCLHFQLQLQLELTHITLVTGSQSGSAAETGRTCLQAIQAAAADKLQHWPPADMHITTTCTIQVLRDVGLGRTL